MINLILGKKGSGKTKKLINAANESVKKSKGNVVVIEKSNKLTYDLEHDVKLISADQFSINGFEALFGFLSGICAANYDVTDILVDSTLKIVEEKTEKFEEFIKKCAKLFNENTVVLTFSATVDESELSEDVKQSVNIL